MDTEKSNSDPLPMLDIHELRAREFGNKPPSLTTIREMTRKGVLPHFRIGKLVRYDPKLVRLALQQHCLVNPKRLRANPEAR